MTITTIDKDSIIKETVIGFKARVMQNYEELSDADMIDLMDALDKILAPKVSDVSIQNRQYNPSTDQVEDI